MHIHTHASSNMVSPKHSSRSHIAYTRTYMHNTHTYIYTYTHTHTRSHHTHIKNHTCMHAFHMHVHIYIRTYIPHTGASSNTVSPKNSSWSHKYIHMYTNTYIYTQIHTYIHANAYKKSYFSLFTLLFAPMASAMILFRGSQQHGLPQALLEVPYTAMHACISHACTYIHTHIHTHTGGPSNTVSPKHSSRSHIQPCS